MAFSGLQHLTSAQKVEHQKERNRLKQQAFRDRKRLASGLGLRSTHLGRGHVPETANEEENRTRKGRGRTVELNLSLLSTPSSATETAEGDLFPTLSWHDLPLASSTSPRASSSTHAPLSSFAALLNGASLPSLPCWLADASSSIIHHPPYPSSNFFNQPLILSDVNWKSTLFELHREGFAAHLARAEGGRRVESRITESALAHIQTAILTLLGATSPTTQHLYPRLQIGTEEEHTYLASEVVDSRIIALPVTGKKTRVLLSRSYLSGLLDLTTLIGTMIDHAVNFGDVFDISAWSLPPTFWSSYTALLTSLSAPGSPRTQPHVGVLPKGLKGASIREIVLRQEEPGARAIGPGPVRAVRIEVEEWGAGGWSGKEEGTEARVMRWEDVWVAWG